MVPRNFLGPYFLKRFLVCFLFFLGLLRAFSRRWRRWRSRIQIGILCFRTMLLLGPRTALGATRGYQMLWRIGSSTILSIETGVVANGVLLAIHGYQSFCQIWKYGSTLSSRREWRYGKLTGTQSSKLDGRDMEEFLRGPSKGTNPGCAKSGTSSS